MKHTVIVTGGTKGLGREISMAFARTGCFVIALYAGDEQAAREFNALLAEAGLSGISLKQDVSSPNPAIWARAEIQEAEQLTLVHNACAAFAPMPMHQLTWRDFENNFLVAVRGAWECSQPLIRLMLKRKAGVIITVSSAVVAGPPPKGFAAYATAKHALRGFTMALAAEYAPRGLRIFSVSPGYMETSLTRQWDERLRDIIRTHSERVSLPADAARKVVELAGKEGIPGQGEDYPI